MTRHPVAFMVSRYTPGGDSSRGFYHRFDSKCSRQVSGKSWLCLHEAGATVPPVHPSRLANSRKGQKTEDGDDLIRRMAGGGR